MCALDVVVLDKHEDDGLCGKEEAEEGEEVCDALGPAELVLWCRCEARVHVVLLTQVLPKHREVMLENEGEGSEEERE